MELSRLTILFSTRRPATIDRFGPSGCAIHSRLHFSRARGECLLTTSARLPGKRLTTVSPARITAGTLWKDRPPIRHFVHHFLLINTEAVRPRAARLRAELFTIRPQFSLLRDS